MSFTKFDPSQINGLITQLTGDVTVGPGSGSQAATVASVGGESAAIVAGAAQNLTNIIDNGGFEIWQRGSGPFSTNGGYCADRWQVIYNGAPTFNFSQETVNVDSGLYALKLNVTAVGGSSVIYVQQYIENYKAYAGKTVTVTVRVKCSVAGLVNMIMFDGVGDAFSSVNVGTGYETLTFTMAISASATHLLLALGFVGAGPATTISTTYFDSVMMVIGSSSAGFTPTNPQQDLARCQRYFQVVGNGTGGEFLNVGQCFSASSAYMIFTFPIVLRVAPTVTLNNITDFYLSSATGAQAVLASSFSVNSATKNDVNIVFHPASGLVAGNASLLSTNTGSGSIYFSADF